MVQNVDARLDLFVTARDGAVWHRRQDPAAPGGWSGWHSMERQGAGFIEVAAGALPDGRLVLWAIADFAGGAPNDLWRREQPRPGAGWQPWTSLADLFKDGPSGPGQIQDPTVAVLPESDVEAVHLFLRGDASAHLEHLLVMSPPAPSLLTKTMALRPPPEAIDDLGPQEQGPP